MLQHAGRKGIGKAIMPSILHEEVLIYEVPKMKKKYVPYQLVSDSNVSDTSSHQVGKVHVHDELRKKREDNAAAAAAGIKLLHDKIEAFDTFLLEGNVTEQKLCQNSFCCEFTIGIVKTDPKTRYRLGVFNGFRSFYVINGSVSVCSVIQCSNQSIESCPSAQTSETVFSSIDISATYYNYEKNLIMPSTLDSELYPLAVIDWSYDEHKHLDHVHVSMSLTKNRNNLLTFGLYARNFVDSSASITASFNTVTYFIALLVVLFLSRL